ncbi:hypothetical protein CH369_17960 [Leptospira levettii]|nr:hypothetical protein CH369_17960 [Leptospira levettii]
MVNEFHLIKINRESHLFRLKEEGVLRSFCGLMETPNYEFKNLKNIFYNHVELTFYLVNNHTLVLCDICRTSYLSAHTVRYNR